MSKTVCKCRYDAAGHKILSHADMLLYFSDDKQSKALVQRFMPYRLVFLPAVEILIDCKMPEKIDIYLVYPGETLSFSKDVSVRAVQGLRATYAGKPGWKVKYNRSGVVCLRREGRAILDPKRRFGIRA